MKKDTIYKIILSPTKCFKKLLILLTISKLITETNMDNIIKDIQKQVFYI